MTLDTPLTFDGHGGVACRLCGDSLPVVPGSKVTDETLTVHAAQHDAGREPYEPVVIV